MTPPSRNDRSRRHQHGPRREPATLDLKATDLTTAAEPVMSPERAGSTEAAGPGIDRASGGEPHDSATPDEATSRVLAEEAGAGAVSSASGTIETDPAPVSGAATGDAIEMGSKGSGVDHADQAPKAATTAADRAIVEENSAGELASSTPSTPSGPGSSAGGAAHSAGLAEGATPSSADKAASEAGPSVTPRLAAASERGPQADVPAAQPRPEGRRGLGFGALLGAGLLGGILGAGGTIAARPWWDRPSNDLNARLAQIEGRVGATAPRDALAGIERRLAGLEGSQAALTGEVRGVRTLAEQAGARAEEALNRPLPPAPAAAEPPADSPALPKLDERLRVLESEVRRLRDTPPAPPPPDPRVADLQSAVASLQQSVEAAQQTSQSRLAALELDQRTQREAASAALDRRIAEQDQRTAGTAQQLAAQDQRLAALDQRLTALAKEGADRTAAPLAASLRVILADRIGAALREGTPYAEALGSLRRLRVDPGQIAALEPFAGSGPPTASALAQEFRPLAEQIRAASRGEAGDWTERLKRMASQVVTVREVGEADRSSASGIVARIDDALARGALRDAAAAWDALPEAARRLSTAWAERLKGRIAAEEAARRLSSASLAALEASTTQ